ncbi:MAG TPA: DUF899 family protein, partial [Gaiellaceae bacterium]|nr:DUF899 family protein [Gaiellaceae bacterium]
MSLPDVVSREEWVAARKELLEKEKELTRKRDALSADRRRLPMVRIDKEYVFEGPNGKASLVDLFDGSRQLMIQHFMFDPAWDEGCPSCTAAADELSAGLLDHLRARQTAFAAISRAPLAKIEAYKQSRGWAFPWYSSFGGEFNYDFHATLDESVAPPMFNFGSRADYLEAGKSNYFVEAKESVEVPGYSCFAGRRHRLPHVLDLCTRGRSARRRLLLPRPDRARPAGGMGG